MEKSPEIALFEYLFGNKSPVRKVAFKKELIKNKSPVGVLAGVREGHTPGGIIRIFLLQF